MTAWANRSRGERHSQAIKRSPRWDAWQANRGRCVRQDDGEPDLTKGWLMLAKAAYGRCDVGNALVRATAYDPDRVSEQMREQWRAGYVQALQDVRRERERQERNRYVGSLPTISRQEAARISHAYDTDRKGDAR